ncbi:glycosyltransferase family 2 protein [Pseudomonas silesiensis]
MNTSTPFFSIILPTYNVEKYVERCINSCIIQSFRDFEIVVVDDQGVDRSIDIVEKLSSIDNRIKIVTNQKNLGTFAARNHGILHASGKYIIFLDPDDEITTNALERLHESLIKTPADILIFGRINFPQSRLNFFKPKLQDRHAPIKSPLTKLFINTPKAYWGTPGKVYSSKVAKTACQDFELVDHRLTYGEDVLFLFVAAIHARNYISISDELYVYYINPESISATKKYEDLLKIKSQLDLVISYINKILEKNANLNNDLPDIKKTLNTIHRALTSDKELLFRFQNNPDTDRPLYIRNSLNSFYARKNPKDILRILTYLITLSNLKL